MTVSLSEKLRKEAGRLVASVDHSDFWRDSGYEPTNEGDHRESELRQISRNIMTSDILKEAIDKDMENFEQFSPARKDNIRIIQDEHQKALRNQDAREHLRKIDEKIHGKKGVKNLWLEAGRKNDFSLVKEDFRELLELERQYARKVIELEERDDKPYKVLYEKYEPDIPLEDVEKLFNKLKVQINELIDELDIPENQRTVKDFKMLSDTIENTEKFHNEIVFDLLQGDHDSILVKEGFYGMERGDALTSGMNVNSDQPWPKAVDTTLHEFGHVDYRSYLPEKFVFLPLGEPASDTIDEACGRLWQVHVGHSRYFSKQITDLAGEYGIEAEQQDYFKAINRIDLENFRRINADELTYHLHIIARFELERGLINGDIEVDNLEEAWDQKMKEYLPEYSEDIEISEKFLQDPHWGKGKFGYYPTYSTGQLAATQIFLSAKNHIEDLEDKLADGDYLVLSEWLADNLYQHGRRYTTQELIRRASGQELSVEPFMKYARDKFGKIY